MPPRAKELLQHEVVGVLPLIKQHGRCEAHWADEECQPARKKHTSCNQCTVHVGEKWHVGVTDSLFLPKARGGCVGWGLPAQTLGEELGQSRGSGPGSRCWGSASACGMVGAALADWRAHTQLHQQAKELSQSPTKSRWSWKCHKKVS